MKSVHPRGCLCQPEEWSLVHFERLAGDLVWLGLKPDASLIYTQLSSETFSERNVAVFFTSVFLLSTSSDHESLTSVIYRKAHTTLSHADICGHTEDFTVFEIHKLDLFIN